VTVEASQEIRNALSEVPQARHVALHVTSPLIFNVCSELLVYHHLPNRNHRIWNPNVMRTLAIAVISSEVAVERNRHSVTPLREYPSIIVQDGPSSCYKLQELNQLHTIKTHVNSSTQ
jgi:hypothetical protein